MPSSRATWTLLLTGGALLIMGCPAEKPAPQPQGQLEANDRPSGKSAPGREIKTAKLPKSMVIGDNVTLSGFYEDEALPDEGRGGEVGDRPNQGGVGERPSNVAKGGGAQTQNLYKIVAPATVIVRSERGYGTGVIYDPAGWILTNHHVVAHAKREDFKWRVNIGIGRLSKGGVMEKEEQTYKAYVHKIAPLLDIAVVKLVKPPKRLVSIRISDQDPVPGQHVTSIGHAGIGLLWAIKDGQISAIGKLSKHLAQLQLYESEKAQAKEAGADPSSERFRQLKAKRLEELRKFLEKKVPALVIQSTADISQGDSGGPLVNDRAEIVGLNAFVRSAGAARKESNFHIHAAELRKFIKAVPADPPQLLPDPWNDSGSLAKLGDADLDSTIDVLAMYKVIRFRWLVRKRAMGYFIDLDQDSFKGLAAVPEVKEVVDKRSFDAEVIFLAHGGYLHAWYDTDNNGKPDVLLVTPESYRSGGKVKGFRIDAKGRLTKDAALAEGTLIRPSLFADGTMARRLVGVSSKLFSYRLLPPSARTSKAYPDPIASAGHTGKLKDYSRDGKPDTVDAQGLFSSGYLFDVDQDSIGGYAVGDPLRKVLQSRKVDPEFTWINVQRTHWAWYDRDNDGRFDLLLKGGRYPGNVVAQGWQVDAAGKYTEDKSHIGKLIVQPELLASADHAAAMRKIVTRVLMSSRVAGGPGVGAFPDPGSYYTWGYQLKSAKRFKDAAVSVRMASGCKGTLVDVDLDTMRQARKAARKGKRKAKKGVKPAKLTLVELVKAKQFDAELAHVECGYDQWSFYDTQGKGAYDLVLYSADKGQGKPTAAYRVDAKGQLAPVAKAIGCQGLVIPALFKNRKLKRNFAKMADALFTVRDINCKP